MRRTTLRAVTLVAALCAAAFVPTPAVAAADTGVPNGDVIANLWSWNWRSVATAIATQQSARSNSSTSALR